MSALMDAFALDLERFRQDCEADQLRVDFLGESYPQRIMIEGMEAWQQQSMDGIEPTKKKNMKVVVCGDVNGMVSMTDVMMPKKELTKHRKGRKAAGAVSACILSGSDAGGKGAYMNEHFADVGKKVDEVSE